MDAVLTEGGRGEAQRAEGQDTVEVTEQEDKEASAR